MNTSQSHNLVVLQSQENITITPKKHLLTIKKSSNKIPHNLVVQGTEANRTSSLGLPRHAMPPGLQARAAVDDLEAAEARVRGRVLLRRVARRRVQQNGRVAALQSVITHQSVERMRQGKQSKAHGGRGRQAPRASQAHLLAGAGAPTAPQAGTAALVAHQARPVALPWLLLPPP